MKRFMLYNVVGIEIDNDFIKESVGLWLNGIDGFNDVSRVGGISQRIIRHNVP